MAQAGAAIGPAQARAARGRSVLVKAGLSAGVRRRSVAAAKPPTGAVRNGASSAASASSVLPAKAARPG
jgi:hypothetical protein